MEELKRNNVASSSQIYDLIYNGRGKMPGYGQGCTPKVILNIQSIQVNQYRTPTKIQYAPTQAQFKFIFDFMQGKCTFLARLPDDQITALTDYVLQQASEGWKS